MINSKNKIAFIIALVVSVGLMSSCGNKDSKEDDKPSVKVSEVSVASDDNILSSQSESNSLETSSSNEESASTDDANEDTSTDTEESVSDDNNTTVLGLSDEINPDDIPMVGLKPEDRVDGGNEPFVISAVGWGDNDALSGGMTAHSRVEDGFYPFSGSIKSTTKEDLHLNTLSNGFVFNGKPYFMNKAYFNKEEDDNSQYLYIEKKEDGPITAFCYNKELGFDKYYNNITQNDEKDNPFTFHFFNKNETLRGYEYTVTLGDTKSYVEADIGKGLEKQGEDLLYSFYKDAYGNFVICGYGEDDSLQRVLMISAARGLLNNQE